MTGDDPGAEAPPPAAVAALVEALEARARQAGAEGSASLVRGMLGSVAEMMHGVEDRLSRLDDAVSGGAAGGEVGRVAEHVQAGLAAFNARLGRLEEAFLRALQDGERGPDDEEGAPVDRLRALVEDGHRRQAESLGAVSAAVEGLAARLDDLRRQLDDVRGLLERHAEETAGSLGRRATEAGRRLAGALNANRRQ